MIVTVTNHSRVSQLVIRQTHLAVYDILYSGEYLCVGAQLELITQQSMKAGFTGGLVVDFPNSTKAKKYV